MAVKREIDFSGFLLFDGGMGTMLQAHGLKTGELPESYNLAAPGDYRTDSPGVFSRRVRHYYHQYLWC